jgi:YhcH/YjgK/YiaL family protein
MALFGSLEYLAELLAHDARFAPGFAYLRRVIAEGSKDAERIRALGDGETIEVALENGTVSFDQAYRTRERRRCFFESHRKCIDIQFVLSGEERIDVVPIGNLRVEHPYDDAKDVAIYADNPEGSALRIKAGEAAIFFPEDGHMPGQSFGDPALVRKTVVKVPVLPRA